MRFTKGDYIVLINKELEDSSKAFKYGYCYRQKESDNYLRPFSDSNGSKTNGWPVINYDKKGVNWRYANAIECISYDIKQEPFNVAEADAIYNSKTFLSFKRGDRVELKSTYVPIFDIYGNYQGYNTIFNSESFEIEEKRGNFLVKLVNSNGYIHSFYILSTTPHGEIKEPRSFKLKGFKFKVGDKIVPMYINPKSTNEINIPYYDEVRKEPIGYYRLDNNGSYFMNGFVEIDEISEKDSGKFKIKDAFCWFHEIDFKLYSPKKSPFDSKELIESGDILAGPIKKEPNRGQIVSAPLKDINDALRATEVVGREINKLARELYPKEFEDFDIKPLLIPLLVEPSFTYNPNKNNDEFKIAIPDHIINVPIQKIVIEELNFKL